jgi:hypothetical protein
LVIIVKPNVYVLGGKPEIDLEFQDQQGVTFIASLVRLSIAQPDGTIITLSGGDMTMLSGAIYSYMYRPPTKGWYEYEGWGRDSAGREIAMTNGFEVIDRVY